MRIGLIEFVLILGIASLTIGPQVMLFVDRWLRRAERTKRMAARRRSEYEAQMKAEQKALLKRFRVATSAVGTALLLLLAYALLLRPLDTPPQSYPAPEVRQAEAQTAQSQTAGETALGEYKNVSCLRWRDGWLYAAVRTGRKDAALVRVREDGSGLAQLLTITGEITGFDFDPEGNIWFTVLTGAGGALYRASYDGWGTAAQQVISQIDGKALFCPTAVAVAQDGKVYFADGTAFAAEDGVEQALRTELLAHTATGWVYVYDPAALTVQRVLGGVSGASGLALDPAGETLYVSDLASRCIWQVSTSAKELTAGGRECGVFADALPGYPGALTVEEDGTVYVSYRWTKSDWLEKNSGSTFLRSIAMRAGVSVQEKLFGTPADAVSAEMLAADGSVRRAFAGGALEGCTAVCPVESRVYLSVAKGTKLYYARV